MTSDHNLWLSGEPPLETILADEPVRLVMRRDGLTETDVRAAIAAARRRLRRGARVPGRAA